MRPDDGIYTTFPNIDRDMTGTPADTDITDNAHKDLISSSELFHVSQAFRYASLILVSVMFIIVSTLKAFWAFGQKSICFLC